MTKEIIEKFVEECKIQNRSIQFILDTIRGNGGYSSCNNYITLNPNECIIVFQKDYFVISNLIYRPKWADTSDKGPFSRFTSSVEHGNIGALVLEYSTVKMLGICREA